MPEMRFRIRWPDGMPETCYSPSLVVMEHLVPGKSYALADFVDRCRTALLMASERVKARYGRPCPRALGQLARIEATSRTYAASADARVTIDGFED